MLRGQMYVYFSIQSTIVIIIILNIAIIIFILISSIKSKILIHIKVFISDTFEKQTIHERSEKTSTKLNQKSKVAPIQE